MKDDNKIKELRIQTGLNRKEFSEYIGISLQTISYIKYYKILIEMSIVYFLSLT